MSNGFCGMIRYRGYNNVGVVPVKIGDYVFVTVFREQVGIKGKKIIAREEIRDFVRRRGTGPYKILEKEEGTGGEILLETPEGKLSVPLMFLVKKKGQHY